MIKNFVKWFGLFALVAIIGFSLVACGGDDGGGTGGGDPRPESPESMSGKTALRYFADEGLTVGINIGNTLEAMNTWTTPGKPFSEETAWGNVKANQAYFTGLKNLGFKIVRIPVSWTGHIGPAPGYKIEEAWLKRVAEVVGYAKTAGLKAFINVHHDGHHDMGGWLDISKAMENTSNRDQIAAQYEAVWKQIAEYFINYGDWLMFQGFNEIHDGSWDLGDGGDATAKYNIINDWNKRFTDTVRATGGNNAQRYLLYYGYNVSYAVSEAGTQFVLPTDSASGKQVVGFHFYSPWTFAGNADDPNWSTEASDKSHFNSVFSAMKTKFIDNGTQVIIGENGPARYVAHSNNPGYNSANVATAQAKRLAYIDYFYGKARENGLVPFFWENGKFDSANAGEGDFALINRSNGQPNSTESRTVIEHMIAAINNTTPPEIGGGDNGGGDDPVPGNLGEYHYGTDGVSINNQQAVWELSEELVTTAQTAGAKLVLVLSAAPSATLQLVWQGPANSLWWNEKKILGDNGVSDLIAATGVTWDSGTKTLTIPLSDDSVADYSVFITQPSLNIIVAYYGGTSVDDLGIVRADIE